MWAPPPGTMPRPGQRQMPAAPEVIHWPYDNPENWPETTGSGHLHVTVTAFNKVNNEGAFTDSFGIQVEVSLADAEARGLTIEEIAIARCKRIIQRNNYRVSGITEICSYDSAIKPKE